MLAGRELAKSGLYLETYLFSPPFNSVPIENLIKNQTLKRVVRIWASIIKAGIAIIVKRPSEDLEEDAFIMLSEWKPNMFVNPKDPICSEYIGDCKGGLGYLIEREGKDIEWQREAAR
ncbi:hypothetical protein E3N88_23481 [Mikania micrantha]|uniref:Uncharacterized protein n=1 Tax=Mikania micrantha TaxID=192012 RepID=A0A5N6NF25_9ASTR|nr:hypothetical protein E3N88_23481 [Mikania micrantha]